MKELLDKALDYSAKYRIVARAHYLAAAAGSRLNRWFGIPVIIITAAVGTTIFGTLEENPRFAWRITAGLISLTGTVLAALQTNLGFAQTSEKHKAAGEKYRSMQRKFELFELEFRPAGHEKRDVAMERLKALVADLDDLPQTLPSVPDKFYDLAKNEETLKQNKQAF